MRTSLAAFGLYLVGAALGAGWAVISAERAGELSPAPASWPEPMAQAAAAASRTPPPPPATGPLRVLFLGNGILEENDLTGIVGGLAAAAGLAPLDAVVDGPGGFSLSRHVSAGRYREHLASGRFDFVVLQEQSQRPAFTVERQARMVDPPVRTLVAAARAAGATPVFFTTWGRRGGDPAFEPGDTYDAMQERVIASYSRLAAEHRALRAPVGDAWQRMLRERPELPLWKADGSHATLLGTYLAACAVYAVLYRRPVTGNAHTAGVDPALAERVQAAVDAAVEVTAGGRRADGPVAGVVAAEPGGRCPDDYDPVEDVCVHRALALPADERLRLVINFKAGLVAPVVEP